MGIGPHEDKIRTQNVAQMDWKTVARKKVLLQLGCSWCSWVVGKLKHDLPLWRRLKKAQTINWRTSRAC